MKIFRFFLLCFCSTTSLIALPIGNPSDPQLLTKGIFIPHYDTPVACADQLNFRLGFYGDYVFNRKLEVETAGDIPIRKTELWTNSTYFAVNYLNWVDLFGTLGASTLKLTFDQSLLSIVGGVEEISAQTSFSWSLGARSALFHYCGFNFGAEGQYFRTHPDLDFITVAGVEVDFPFIRDIDLLYQEWQIGFGVDYPIQIDCRVILIPYFGYKFSYAKANFFKEEFVDGSFSFTVENNTLRNSRRRGGYAFGLTLVGGCVASITAEIRFIDEKAVHVNCQFSF